MLMPEQKRQLKARRALKEQRKEKRKARRWLLYCLTDNLDRISDFFPQLPHRSSSKAADGTLEGLKDDCLLEIMHHSKLQPDLWNLLRASGRCRTIWEKTQRSILIGMQEEKFPEYIEMFGKIGNQSRSQLRNLAKALARDAWGLRAEIFEPEISFLDLREDNVRLYEKSLILYLESTDDYFNHRVQLLHELGDFETCSQQVTKSAVLALWEMGWSQRSNGEWRQAGRIGSSFMVIIVSKILKPLPEPVRLRIRDILHILASRIYQTSGISSDMKPWVEDREECIRRGMTHSIYDAFRWHQEATNATIVMEIVFRGIGGAIEYVHEIDERQDGADEMGQVQCPRFLRLICGSRKNYDERGHEDLCLRDLKNHVKVAQKLEVDIFA